MKKFTVKAYKEGIEALLTDTGAFLRISRTDGLFVSDLPRKKADIDGFIKSLNNAFEVKTDHGLLYLTPVFPEFSHQFQSILVSILKENGDKREKLIRNALAVAMRKKNLNEIDFLENILKEESENEN